MIGWLSGLQAQQQYLFSHLGKREGLAADIVMATQQDAKGYIWIATTEGLERFDGQRFVLFRHRLNDSTSIPRDKIMHALIDKSNRLWLLFEYNSVGYMSLNDQHFHHIPVRLDEAKLRRGEGHLFMDSAGHVSLVLHRQAVLTFDEHSHEFSTAANPFPLPQGWNPNWLYQDGQAGNYWIACDSGLLKYNPVRKTLSRRGHNDDNDPIIAHYAPLTHVSLPYLDRKGRFWLSAWPPDHGYAFYSFDTHSGRWHDWEPPITMMVRYKYHEIHYLGEQSDGTIWIAGINLLAELRNNSDNFELLQSQFTGEFNLHYDLVQHLLEDRERNIWISSDKGLYRFNPAAQVFHTISDRWPGKDTVYTPEVTDILQTRNGEILVSTWGNGIFAYDSNFKPLDRQICNLSRTGKEVMTWCLHERLNGDIWRGNQEGRLIIFHQSTHTEDNLLLPVFKGSTIRQIAEDKEGNCWLGTHKGDLIKWVAASNTFMVVQNLGSPVQRLYTDKQGNIWAATVKTGIYTIDPLDGHTIYHYTAEGPEGQRLMNIGVTDIVQTSDSVFLIASGALHVLNPYTHHIRVILPVNGVPASTINSLIMDRRGYCWIATENGLCKMDIRNEARSSFSEADGIGSGTFSIGSACLLKDGRIAIGTAHDFMVFRPEDITSENQQPPDVEIGNIALMNKWLSMDSLSRLDHIELPYDRNAIRIVFSTLTYQNSYGIGYKLEGLDKDWIPSESNEAIYNYLPPGQYVFKVNAMNSLGVHSLHTREIHITVMPPFWRSWWFYGCVALALAAILYAFDRQRMQKKASLQEIRSNISDNLHEEIHTALEHINVLSEIARIKAGKAPEQSINYINEIHHKSRSMIIALEDMLWSIDPANDNMQRAIGRMRESAAALCQRPDTRIEVQADDKVFDCRPDMKIRHELMLVYKLSLRLLVEELKARHTIVQLDLDRSQLILNIFAAGIRPDKNHHTAKLLEEMKARALAIKGTLDLQFDEKGAAIIFICPSIS